MKTFNVPEIFGFTLQHYVSFHILESFPFLPTLSTYIGDEAHLFTHYNF